MRHRWRQSNGGFDLDHCFEATAQSKLIHHPPERRMLPVLDLDPSIETTAAVGAVNVRGKFLKGCGRAVFPSVSLSQRTPAPVGACASVRPSGTLRSVRHLACSNSIRAWAPAKLKEMVLFGIVQVL